MNSFVFCNKRGLLYSIPVNKQLTHVNAWCYSTLYKYWNKNHKKWDVTYFVVRENTFLSVEKWYNQNIYEKW